MRQRQKNPAVPPPNERTTQNPKLPTSDYHKPLTKSDLFSSTKTVFALCLAFRVANALLVQTYFNPDEHWQALEVAHRIAFGYLQFGSFLFCLFAFGSSGIWFQNSILIMGLCLFWLMKMKGMGIWRGSGRRGSVAICIRCCLLFSIKFLPFWVLIHHGLW